MKRSLSFLAVALVLAGCNSGGGFSKRSQDARAGALTYAMAVAPTTLDPAIVQDIDTNDLLLNVYEGLVAYDEQNRIVPQLAKEWTVSEDGRTYTFKLREAKFHDGTPVTAEDVLATFERNLAKSFNSPTAINYLSDIVGATAYNEGRAKTIEGIKVVDPMTVTITIDTSRPYFLGKLTYACAYILPKSAPKGQINKREEVVGTGPFRLADYIPDQKLTLTAVADYYGGAPTVEKIERPIILDASTRLNKYRSGEIDMLKLERQDLDAVKNDPKLAADLKVQPRPAVFYIGLNQYGYAPFKDKRIRQAFAMAIDRKRIVEDLLGGLPPAQGLIAHHVVGARADLAGIPYDPERAKQLLAEAGHPGGKGLPTLRLTYRAQTPDSQTACEAAANSIRQATGWVVKPTALEWSALLTARNNRKLESYFLSWYADYLDPENFLSFLFRSDSPQNRDGYANAKFDQLTREADTEQDEAKRMKLYADAEDILLDDVARIPIYFGQDSILMSPRISGVRANLFGYMPHSRVVVK